jgi:hypothetical protein
VKWAGEGVVVVEGMGCWSEGWRGVGRAGGDQGSDRGRARVPGRDGGACKGGRSGGHRPTQIQTLVACDLHGPSSIHRQNGTPHDRDRVSRAGEVVVVVVEVEEGEVDGG